MAAPPTTAVLRQQLATITAVEARDIHQGLDLPLSVLHQAVCDAEARSRTALDRIKVRRKQEEYDDMKDVRLAYGAKVRESGLTAIITPTLLPGSPGKTFMPKHKDPSASYFAMPPKVRLVFQVASMLTNVISQQFDTAVAAINHPFCM